MGDGNENCANDDYDGGKYDSDVTDQDSDGWEMDEETRPIQTLELDKDLSQTLSKMASRLCSICCNFPKGRFNTSPGYSNHESMKLYHNSFLSLQESVDRGCPLCLDLSKGLKELEKILCLQRDMDQSPSIWGRLERSSWEGSRGLRMVFCLCCRDGRPLSDWSNVRLTFFPPEVLGIGPEFRGTKPIICLAVVI